MKVQDVKDTFYAVLRDRVAAGNSERTTVVRGALRPAVVVEENEIALAGSAQRDAVVPLDAMDVFALRWTTLRVTNDLLALGCEVHYRTVGTAAAAGLDRGRALGALDAELIAALAAQAQQADGFAVTEPVAGAAVRTPAGTRIFWSDAVFGPVKVLAGQVGRSVSLEVFGYA